MAWNGSDLEPTSRARADVPRAPLSRRGLIAGLLVVVFAGAALWYFFLSSSTLDSNSTAPRSPVQIVEQKPAPARTNKVAKAEIAKPKTPKPEIETNAAGERLMIDPNNGRPYYRKKADVDLRSFIKRRFKYESEEQIAMLLETKPGEYMLGDYIVPDRFVVDFNNSLYEEIVVNPDDDEQTKELKEAVSEAKKNLKDAMDRGEDIKKIMRDSYYDLQKLGQYKDDILQELATARKNDSVSADDYEDYVAAANKLLETKGIKPIRHPTFLMKSIRLNKEKNALQNN